MEIFSKITFWRTFLLLSVVMFTLSTNTSSQPIKEDFQALLENDSSEFQRLWLYPEEIRSSIYLVATRPELLFRISSRQQKTQQEFGNLVSPYPTETQKKVWELTRYPKLITSLIKESDSNLDELLIEYPWKIKDDAKYIALRERILLQEIELLTSESNDNLDELLINHSNELKEATYVLVKYPETLSILSANMNMTIVLGDTFRDYPEWLEETVKGKNLKIVQQQNEDWLTWKEEIENDPKAKKELEKAAKEFSDETGLNGIRYDPDQYEEEESEENRTYIYTQPYSFWFGYPYWYPAPIWHPAPLWHYTGWYYGPRGFAVYDMPNRLYFNWYYNWGYRRYPRVQRYVPVKRSRQHIQGAPKRRGGFNYSKSNNQINTNRNRSYWNYRSRSTDIYGSDRTVRSRSRTYNRSSSHSKSATRTRSRKTN